MIDSNSFQRYASALYDNPLLESTDEYTTVKEAVWNKEKYKHIYYKIKYYKSKQFKHRYDGPAVMIYDLENDNLLEVSFYHNNVFVPDWVPKVSEYGLSHPLNNGTILKVSLKYSAEYALFLKKYYEDANKEIGKAKEILSEMIYEMVKYKGSSDLDYLCTDIYQIVKPDSITIEVAKKLIKEVILGMAVDNIIEYNEESNFIKIKEKENGISAT